MMIRFLHILTSEDAACEGGGYAKEHACSITMGRQISERKKEKGSTRVILVALP